MTSKTYSNPLIFILVKKIFFKDFYLFIHERHKEREAETQAEGEAGSMQGARYGTRSRVSRITPLAEGSAKLLSHQGCPQLQFLGIGTAS